ncbi:thioredoxin-like protein YusE [Paraliobacillus quinghaiensis]|uniref:Thioredoxin-like protein YusE n=1 Tax=Paraliobacillus quinghaiensis TaxID=470815 RepID=A0A917TUB4_9BACI|nr:thioredoxin family protein [Paraliobacillus quinghaiensis]GGM35787.1 thioredoxin-like protein YusE [Paraliobacillus quinghaiensis]
MISITRNNLHIVEHPGKMIFIHSPFCGTCHVARRILNGMEEKANESIFYELNAGLFPEFMYDNKVESVPCLLITKEGEPEKMYSFESIIELYSIMHHN